MRNHRRFTASLALVAFVFALALPSVAGAQSAARKAGRGLAGMTTFFLEIPGNMTSESRKSGYGKGLPLGFAIGLGKMIPRVLVGVYEFLTCPFPAPAGFKPILRPEFPWSYFEDQPRSG